MIDPIFHFLGEEMKVEKGKDKDTPLGRVQSPCFPAGV